jgi:hypothetical protein
MWQQEETAASSVCGMMLQTTQVRYTAAGGFVVGETEALCNKLSLLLQPPAPRVHYGACTHTRRHSHSYYNTGRSFTI